MKPSSQWNASANKPKVSTKPSSLTFWALTCTTRTNIQAYQAANELYQEWDPQSPNLAHSYFNSGLAYEEAKQYNDAIQFYAIASEHYETVNNDKEQVARTMRNLGRTAQAQGNYDQAIDR